ncbi:MAG TPA: phosphoglycerate dehydrogenase [Deltaproteobacteria bacterium]|nr:phosphoglycerate dehydrogenase [Deltaproteobacteria bacterium]HPP81149.1 phosphoglycerate dehydrogenase [Deltaproteobacteria bacterium]
MKILVSDKLSEAGVDILKKGGFTVDVKTGLKPEELKAIIGDYDALIVRSATKATADIIEAGRNLKVIGRAGAGVDNIDSAAATKRGIVVMNTPGGNTVTTGEHAIALMMSLTRNIPKADAFMKEGKWEKKALEGREVTGKTLGIIGMGRVGSVVASRALGLKMNVIVYDPFITRELAESQGIELVSLDDIYARSDYITVHTPKTKETTGLIGKEAFSKMKKGVFIINCARGGIIDEAALVEALDAGIVAGAAIDVFVKEPPEDWTLAKHPKVVATPHLGASTLEAQENVALAIAEQVVDYLKNGVIRNAVNAPSVSPEMLPKVRPYIELAEKMGMFMGQIIGQVISDRLKKVSIVYTGAASGVDTKPVTVSAIKGLLGAIADEVNYVNAPALLKERGIDLVESSTSKEEVYTNTIEMTLEFDKGTRSLTGSVFGKNDLRIVRIDKYSIEVIPEGYMLVIYNKDLPGTVGKFGTILGEAGINIARLFLGRDRQEGTAIVIINVDTEVPKKVLDKLRKVPNALSVQEVVI